MRETPSPLDPATLIAEELNISPQAVRAVIELLDDGGTVPFIARYRKEATGGLDEVQIRTIEERQSYLQELEKRRETVLYAIREQGKLSTILEQRIRACVHKQELEDLYLPYKKKRKTKGMLALEKGLGPLAERILAQPKDGDPDQEAMTFIDPSLEILHGDDALRFARDIVIDQIVEDADIRAYVRDCYLQRGKLRAKAAPGQEQKRSKFEDYYDYEELAVKVPSHRYLAIRRGEKEGILRTRIEAEASQILPRVEQLLHLDPLSPFAKQLALAARSALTGRLSVGVETDLRVKLKGGADEAAIEVFADNLEHLLLAAPLGSHAVVGIDPGLGSGCKCAALDPTGNFLETVTIFLTRGERESQKANQVLGDFIRKHQPHAIAIGNGTGGRECEKFVRALLSATPTIKTMVVSVSEAGASVYSASDLAREEFPELDLTIRGAISIARRLQDPLAELVKIDPKAIGVGQYQHDVFQSLLLKKLHEVVESCVNRVGVELNTASVALLSYLSGVGKSLAKKIVEHREKIGGFTTREGLLSVPGMGPRTYEQAVGFLRVRESQNPLDRSAVHPERYALVERIAKDMGRKISEMVGDGQVVQTIDIARYVDQEVGEPTLNDIVLELKKPGRDPRQEFENAQFHEDIHAIEDLKDGMRLDGIVTNVTAFGAFVDLGVHQDGLIHISQLADHFVKDPRDVVKVGDKIKVHVLSVDLERKRIALSARSKIEHVQSPARNSEGKPAAKPVTKKKPAQREKQKNTPREGFSNNPFAQLKRD